MNGGPAELPLPDLPPPPPASSPAVRAVMQANRGQDTGPEVLVRSELHRRGLRFRKHYRPVPGLRCQADIAFPREQVAVFIDGCFWHDCPLHGRRPKQNADWWRRKIERNVLRDRRNDTLLHAAGWLVVRAWEHHPPNLVADRVAQAVVARRPAADPGGGTRLIA